MRPQFKIKENKKGEFEVYYIERHETFFKKEILKPYITWSGLDEVFPFDNIDIAIKELGYEVIKSTERI